MPPCVLVLGSSLQSNGLRRTPRRKIHPAAYHAATPRTEPSLLSNLRVGALSGSTTVKQQKFVAKSAISAVEGTDAFVGVKKNARPIIVIGSYDSFMYNLCQYMGEVGANFEVYRNDEITVEEIKILAGRYHSLVTEKDSFPHDTLEIVAWTDDGLIMAARHRIYPESRTK